VKTRPQLRGGDAPVEEYAMRLLCAFIVCALIGLLGSTSVAKTIESVEVLRLP